MPSNKALVMTTNIAIAMLILITIFVVFYFVILKFIFRFHVIPREAQARTHGIIIANVLLSYKDLIFQDANGNFYRGTFDSSKLDKVSQKGEIEDIGFPNSYTIVVITYAESGEINAQSQSFESNADETLVFNKISLSPETCSEECQNKGYSSGACKYGCSYGETSIGRDGCPPGDVCCCSGGEPKTCEDRCKSLGYSSGACKPVCSSTERDIGPGTCPPDRIMKTCCCSLKVWSFYFYPQGIKEENIEKFLNCYNQYIGPVYTKSVPELYKCLISFITEAGVYMDEFPVSIYKDGEIYLGKMAIIFSQVYK
jgi:hypothetical protein